MVDIIRTRVCPIKIGKSKLIGYFRLKLMVVYETGLDQSEWQLHYGNNPKTQARERPPSGSPRPQSKHKNQFCT